MVCNILSDEYIRPFTYFEYGMSHWFISITNNAVANILYFYVSSKWNYWIKEEKDFGISEGTTWVFLKDNGFCPIFLKDEDLG